ncbi:MAG: hypothetical protein J7540_06695, partial [Roseofilum sp. SID2]
ERIPSVWNGKQFQARELVERGSLLSDEGNPHAFRLGRMSTTTPTNSGIMYEEPGGAGRDFYKAAGQGRIASNP